MIIQCPECGKKYKIDPEKIPDKGAKITCPNCKHSFLVRKKKEKEEPKPEIKTPPCQICGNPSSRVLKGDPPMILCEACFVREMEKRRRFEVHPPPFTEAEPETTPPPPSEEEEETTEKIPSEKEEEEYFDSFAEIPDLGEYEKEIPPEPEVPQPPAEELIPPAPEEPVFEEAEFEESTFEELEKPSPPPEPEIPPEPPPPAEPSAPEEPSTPETDFVFSPQEVESLEDTAPTAEEPTPEIKREAPIPSVQEEALEKEIFQEIAEEAKPQKIPPRRERKKFSFPLSGRNMAIIGIILVLLVGGYFLYSNEKVRSALLGLPALFRKGAEEKKPVELSPAEKQNIQEHLALAKELYQLDTKDGYLKSLNEIRTALKINPNNPQAKKMELIVSALLTYRYPQKLLIYKLRSSIKKAEASFGSIPEVWLAKAILNLAENDFASAKVLAQRALEKAPEEPLALWLSAHIQLAGINPDYQQVKALLEKALEQEPKLVLALCELGEIFLKAKNYSNAISTYEEILQISPDHKLAREKLALVRTLSAQKPQPEKKAKEEELLLVEKPKPEEEALPLEIKPGQTPDSTAEEAPPPEQGKEINLDQEIINFWLKIISETRKPLSRTRASKPTAPAPAPAPTAPAPTRPPEEAPSHPPEEAP